MSNKLLFSWSVTDAFRRKVFPMRLRGIEAKRWNEFRIYTTWNVQLLIGKICWHFMAKILATTSVSHIQQQINQNTSI